MEKKLRVLTVVGTRPEIIRLSCVLNKLNESKSIEHILVHTGQNYDIELNDIFFKDLNIKEPDYYLDAAGKNASETIGKILVSIDPILEKVKPDAFLVLGDTNSALCAIPAKKHKIPIFHMEAGNRCFDERVPEETNRKIVDHIADINLTYSSIAREYLLKEGIFPDRVIKTGSPMFEVINSKMKKINASSILKFLNLTSKEFFVVSIHREENVNSENILNKLVKALNLIAEKYAYPIIVSTHPRTRKRIIEEGINFHPLVRLIKPVSFTDYLKLQIESKAVLSDSGTISEESSILNFPALNLREAHERPEAMEEASVMMVGANIERIMQGLEIIENQRAYKKRLINPVSDYMVTNFSEKILRIVLSYTDYINKKVWKKN